MTINCDEYLKIREAIANPEKREELRFEAKGDRIFVFPSHGNRGLFEWLYTRDVNE